MGRKNAFKLDVVSIRLVRDAPMVSESEITSPKDAISLVGAALCEMDREVTCIINLRTDGVPINCNFASVGALNYSMAHPRELLKSSILSNANSIVLCHNHPSGKLVPSTYDIRLTHRMQQLCELVGIPLQDHIIIGRDNEKYFSFLEKGIIKNESIVYQTDYQSLEWDKTSRVAEEVAENEIHSR